MRRALAAVATPQFPSPTQITELNTSTSLPLAASTAARRPLFLSAQQSCRCLHICRCRCAGGFGSPRCENRPAGLMHRTFEYIFRPAAHPPAPPARPREKLLPGLAMARRSRHSGISRRPSHRNGVLPSARLTAGGAILKADLIRHGLLPITRAGRAASARASASLALCCRTREQRAAGLGSAVIPGRGMYMLHLG